MPPLTFAPACPQNQTVQSIAIPCDHMELRANKFFSGDDEIDLVEVAHDHQVARASQFER